VDLGASGEQQGGGAWKKEMTLYTSVGVFSSVAKSLLLSCMCIKHHPGITTPFDWSFKEQGQLKEGSSLKGWRNKQSQLSTYVRLLLLHSTHQGVFCFVQVYSLMSFLALIMPHRAIIFNSICGM
jgi:hypothetical protein